MNKLIPGVTTGIWSAARAEELSTPAKKLGYTITRGVRAVEFALDAPQEVTYTDGLEIRSMAKKQDITITMHGSLNVPLELPDRFDWRDADELMKRNVRSACNVGALYIDFHASLNIWLELLTFTGRRLVSTFSDHEGNFFSSLFKNSGRLRRWFIKKRLERYAGDILTPEEGRRIDERIRNERDTLRRRMTESLYRKIEKGELTPTQAQEESKKLDESIAEAVARRSQEVFREEVDKKLAKGEPWHSEDLRGVGGAKEGYDIMFRYLFYTKDPQFLSMMQFYKKEMDKYKLDFNDDDWPDSTLKKVEDTNDLEFKEFFYAVCAAKYIEGHMVKLKEWINKELIPKEFSKYPEAERLKLQENARKMKIGLEFPDARDPSYPGRYMIWRPKQIYSCVKTVRQVMKDDFLWIIPDFEHLAMQGPDPVLEMEDTCRQIPDFGEYIISCHSNSPNPLQPHNPIELGDIKLYKIFWALKNAGLAKNRDVFFYFERGGGEDPFKKSVDALRLIIKYLELNTHPDKLPLEFFGISEKFEGNALRQSQIIKDHAQDVMKDLLEMPEEDWTMLSQAVIRKGKKPEQWKRAEFR